MTLIDSHAHLFLEEFAEDLPQVIEHAQAAGVTHIFMPNIDSTTLAPLLAVCSTYKNYCYPMIGLHPTSVHEGYKKELEMVAQQLAAFNGYVAVGEIGMDLYWDKTFVKEQQLALEQQIDWALEYDLPVVLHCRDAFDYIYKVLEPYKSTSLKGVFHSFTGNAEEAAHIMEFTNFCIGINGVVTFKKSVLPAILAQIPLNRILLETDSPYLSPVPNRGKRNESANVKYTLLKVAEIYGMSSEEVGNITSRNSLKVFGMLK